MPVDVTFYPNFIKEIPSVLQEGFLIGVDHATLFH